MPLIQVWLRKGTAPAHRQGISKSIHRAMVDVLGIPEDDYFQVTHELDAEDMLFDPHYFGLPRSERFIMIRLSFNAPPLRFDERQIQGAAFSSDGSTVYLIEWGGLDGVVKFRLQSPGAEYRQVAAKQVDSPQPGPGIALDEAAGQVIVPLRAAGSHGEHVVLLDLDLKVLGRYPHAGVPKKDHFEDGVQTAAVSGGRIAVADSYNHRVQLLRRDPANPARLQLERHVNQGMKRRSEFPWGVVLEQDHLFVTSVNQAAVKVYLARTGALLQQVQSPVNLAGLCRFGGSLLAMPYTSDEGTDQVVCFAFKA